MKYLKTFNESLTDEEYSEIYNYLYDIFQELIDSGFLIKIYIPGWNSKARNRRGESHGPLRTDQIEVDISRQSGDEIKSFKYNDVGEYILSSEDYMKSVGFRLIDKNVTSYWGDIVYGFKKGLPDVPSGFLFGTIDDFLIKNTSVIFQKI